MFPYIFGAYVPKKEIVCPRLRRDKAVNRNDKTYRLDCGASVVKKEAFL
jgi:hypothetical protein